MSNLYNGCTKTPLKLIVSRNFNFHASAKCWRERYAVKILAVGTLVDRECVEKQNEYKKHADCSDQADDNSNQPAPSVQNAERHVWQQRKR